MRELTQQEMAASVSKQVKSARDYEQTVLREYKAYLKNLESIARGASDSRGEASHQRRSRHAVRGPVARKKGLQITAVQCMCSLLEPLCHFNMAHSLGQAMYSARASVTADWPQCSQSVSSK